MTCFGEKTPVISLSREGPWEGHFESLPLSLIVYPVSNRTHLIQVPDHSCFFNFRRNYRFIEMVGNSMVRA